MKKPLFCLAARTVRVGLTPHYKHLLKEPLWPVFLPHSPVLLTDSWPRARHKSRTHSFEFQAAHFSSESRCHFNRPGSCQTQASSHKGFVCTETCFHKNQDPHKALLWPCLAFMAKEQTLDYWVPSRVRCPESLPVLLTFWQALSNHSLLAPQNGGGLDGFSSQECCILFFSFFF